MSHPKLGSLHGQQEPGVLDFLFLQTEGAGEGLRPLEVFLLRVSFQVA